VSEDGKKVRRVHPLPDVDLEEVQVVSSIMTGLCVGVDEVFWLVHMGMIWVGLCCLGFVYVELGLLVLISGTVGSSCKGAMPREEETFASVKYLICCECHLSRMCVDVVLSAWCLSSPVPW
jgi:hypothetical protein